MIVDMFTTNCYVSSNIPLAKELKLPSLDFLSNFKTTSDYKNGQTTFFSHHKLPDNLFKKLDNYIIEESLKYFTDMKLKPQKNIQVERSWLSMMNRNGNHGLHVHTGMSILSGSFYIDINKNHAPLTLIRPDWNSDSFKMLKVEENNQYTSQSYVIPPEIGQLILFKSDLPHEIMQNEEDGRLVVSFNVTYV